MNVFSINTMYDYFVNMFTDCFARTRKFCNKIIDIIASRFVILYYISYSHYRLRFFPGWKRNILIFRSHINCSLLNLFNFWSLAVKVFSLCVLWIGNEFWVSTLLFVQKFLLCESLITYRRSKFLSLMRRKKPLIWRKFFGISL